MKPSTEECRQTLEELEQFLDGELAPGDQQHVLDHLEKCMECYHAFDLQAELKQIVAKKCRNEPLPASLRDRIHQALADETP